MQDGPLSLEQLRQLLRVDAIEYVSREGRPMSAAQKYIDERLAAMRTSRENLTAMLQQLEAKREELAGHINAHNGGIAELERLQAAFVGEQNGQDTHEGPPRRPDGQAEQVPGRVDEPAKIAVSG